MHEKKCAYRRAGVAEYLVWLTEENTVAWFQLIAGEYQLLPQSKGLIHSKIFPGLVLDTKALLKRDGAKLVAALGDSNQLKSAPLTPRFRSPDQRPPLKK